MFNPTVKSTDRQEKRVYLLQFYLEEINIPKHLTTDMTYSYLQRTYFSLRCMMGGMLKQCILLLFLTGD